MARTSYIQWNDEDDDEVHFVLDQLDMSLQCDFFSFVLCVAPQQKCSIVVDYLFIWGEHQASKAPRKTITLGLTTSDVHLKVMWQFGWRGRQPGRQPKHT
jgi:hypothetical protein